MSQPSAENQIWKQFKKRPIGVFSLYIMLFLFGVAVYAPLLANNQPIAIKTTYGQVYAYFYAGWVTVHDTLATAVAERETLRKDEADASARYEEERAALRDLTAKYNQIGDAYDEARKLTNRAQDEIDALTAQLTAAREAARESEVTRLTGEIEKATTAKLPLDDKAKELGGQKSEIKREMDERKARQEGYNEVILRTQFRLNHAQQAEAIRVNLGKITFAVDDEIRAKLGELEARYEALFPRLSAGGDTSALVTELGALRAEAEALAPANVDGHLIYRWTFPALADLDLSDRFFMFGYALLLLAFTRWSRVPGHGVWSKLAVIGGVALGLAVASAGLRTDLPHRNYKNVFVDNVQSGKTDSVVVMAPVPYGMNENRVEEQFQKPSWVAYDDGRHGLHVLGTDDSGRDVLSRMIWGARVSLSVGFVAGSIYMFLGIVIGSLAGFFGGKVDLWLSRLIEIVICFPSFFLILTVIAFIGPSIYNVMVVIGLTSWTGVARLTRAEFLRLRNLDFVMAARAAGMSGATVMFRHVLPNAMTPVMVAAAFSFAGTILTESGLSFLGFGVQEPFPSWGQMLSDGKSNPTLYWWLFIVPGIALFLTVTFCNLAANAFRDAADPRLRM